MCNEEYRKNKGVLRFGVLFSSLDVSMFMEMRAGEFWQGLGCPEMGIVARGCVLYLLEFFYS